MPLVQRKLEGVAVPHHLDVVVARLGFVQQLATLGRANRAAGVRQRHHRHRERQHRGHGRLRHRAQAQEPDQRRHEQQPAENQKRAPRANPWDQHQHGQETSRDRTHSPQRIRLAGNISRVLDIRHPQPDRIGTDEPQERDRHRKNQQHAEQRTVERAHRDIVERVEGELKDRPRQVRKQRAPHRGKRGHRVQHPQPGIAIGQPTAKPVPNGQVRHGQADDVRPDEGRIAEKGRDQARGTQLGADARHPAEKHDEENKQVIATGKPARCWNMWLGLGHKTCRTGRPG